MDSYYLVIILAISAALVIEGELSWTLSNRTDANENNSSLTNKSNNVRVVCGEPLNLSCTFQTSNRASNCSYWKKDGQKYPALFKTLGKGTIECSLSIAKTERKHHGKWTCGIQGNGDHEGLSENVSVNIISSNGSKGEISVKSTDALTPGEEYNSTSGSGEISVNFTVTSGEVYNSTSSSGEISDNITETLGEVYNSTSGSGEISNSSIGIGTLFIVICVIAVVVILLVAVKLITYFNKRSKIRRSDGKPKKAGSPSTSHHDYEEIDEANILPTMNTLESPFLPTKPRYKESVVKIEILEPLNPMEDSNYEHPITSGISAHWTANPIKRNSTCFQNTTTLTSIPNLPRNACSPHDYHNIQC